jgi:hypothetical protein
MFVRTVIATAISLALAGPAPAQDAELAKIREEIRQMKEGYERRIEALEKRLAEAEARGAAPAREAPADAQASAAAPARSGRAGDSAFNPAISLTLQGTYASLSQDPNAYQITGFVPSGGEVGPPKRSFGLAETELSFSASIDPYFRGVVIAALTPENEAEVEEAYFQTLSLPRGFTLKGGRFLSGIGYLNEIHQHAWDFQDAPLPYKAFLGGRLGQDGVQLRWIAPTPFFLELGGEIGSGEEFPGADRNKNGANMTALFGRLGGDIGASYSWRSGLSYLRTSPQDRAYEDVDSLGGPTLNAFSGSARIWALDGVLKWAPNGNASSTNFKLQGEYFRMKQDGTLAYDDSGGSAVFGSVADSLRTSQSGWYAQAIYQFMPRWRVGYRYDALRHGTVENGIVANGLGPTTADFPVLASHSPSRNTAMLDFSPSEFSRFRVQLASDKSRIGVTDHQILLQYIHSLGAHGAHRF